MAADRPSRIQTVNVREALVGDLPPRPRSGVRTLGSWAKPVAAIAVLATVGAFAFRFAAPRNHDFAGALEQAERLVAEGRLAEAGSLLLGRIAPERLAATPEESLRFETVHQAWLDAVKAARESRREPPAKVVQAEPVQSRPVEPQPVQPELPKPEPSVAASPEPVLPNGTELFALAEADAEAGRHEAARMRFESAISLGLPPESMAQARLGLAESLAAIGDHAAARAAYTELSRMAPDAGLRASAAESALDRVDAMLALGEFETALGYAEVAEPLVERGSATEVSLAVRRASTRLALANRLVVEGDRESAKPLARAAAAEFLRADGLEVATGAPPAGFAAGTFARLASESMRIVSDEVPSSAPVSDAVATFLRAEMRRDAGLAATRALLAATSDARDGLIAARLEAYASAFADYESVAAADAAGDLGVLASRRSIECLVALHRLPEAIARLEQAGGNAAGPEALDAFERGLELARHARDSVAVERILASGRKALDATPDAALASSSVPRSRAEWQKLFLPVAGGPSGLATVPEQP